MFTPGGEQRVNIPPKGTNFTPGARSEVKNGPLLKSLLSTKFSSAILIFLRESVFKDTKDDFLPFRTKDNRLQRVGL
jgi:hypothetical protein